MDIATFRSILPEFANSAIYSDAQITYWLATGQTMLSATIWGALQDQGLVCYTAHNLVLARRRAKAAAAGGTPGQTQGVVASKGVDKVNIAYDTNSVALENGGLWNSTDYGIQFLQLARMVGAQGMTQTMGDATGVNTGVFGGGYIG